MKAVTMPALYIQAPASLPHGLLMTEGLRTLLPPKCMMLPMRHWPFGEEHRQPRDLEISVFSVTYTENAETEEGPKLKETKKWFLRLMKEPWNWKAKMKAK